MRQYFSKENRALLSELVRTDFKLRYQGSALGYAWSLIRPLLIFLILYLVFVKFLRVGADIPHAPIYLLLGIVLWQFFADMTTQSLGSVVARGDLIRKIKIPRWIIVFSSSILATINLLLNLLVVSIFMFFNKAELMGTAALLPLIILEVYVFALGLSLLLSAAFVKFRDVGYIWEVILQAGFYATPILYPLTLIGNTAIQKIMLMNPMAQAIQDARYAVVSHDPIVLNPTRVFSNFFYTLIPVIIVVVITILGYLYFRNQSKTFAENI